MREPIPLPVVNGRGLVYNIEDLQVLREKFSVNGVLIGVLQRFPQQNVFQGLPLELMREDVKYLLEKGIVVLVDDTAAHRALEPIEKKQNDKDTIYTASATSPALSGPSPEYEQPDPNRYNVYKALMDRGYFILPGIRFGCQYMAYPGDMMRYHSHFNANGFGWNEPFRVLDIVSGGRLATSVKKCWVVGAKENEDSDTRLFSIEWAAFG